MHLARSSLNRIFFARVDRQNFFINPYSITANVRRASFIACAYVYNGHVAKLGCRHGA